MNRLAFSIVVLIVFNSVISALANVKITPIAVENKSNLKASDLKVEEARYRDPVMPEYYGSNGYDRNRQNFVTGSSYGSYGGGMSSYDRYGSGMGYDRYGSGAGGDRYGSNIGTDRYGSGISDRYGGSNIGSSIGGGYGSQWNRDKMGVSKYMIGDCFQYCEK